MHLQNMHETVPERACFFTVCLAGSALKRQVRVEKSPLYTKYAPLRFEDFRPSPRECVVRTHTSSRPHGLTHSGKISRVLGSAYMRCPPHGASQGYGNHIYILGGASSTGCKSFLFWGHFLGLYHPLPHLPAFSGSPSTSAEWAGKSTTLRLAAPDSGLANSDGARLCWNLA